MGGKFFNKTLDFSLYVWEHERFFFYFMHSFRICPLICTAVWSESSLGAFWIAKNVPLCNCTEFLWKVGVSIAQLGVQDSIFGVICRISSHLDLYCLHRYFFWSAGLKWLNATWTTFFLASESNIVFYTKDLKIYWTERGIEPEINCVNCVFSVHFVSD